MTNAVRKRMSVEDFFAWDSGDDHRYELRDGMPVMMAPTLRTHRFVASQLHQRIGSALRRRPGCMVEMEAGLRSVHNDRSYYVADIAVSCTPVRRGERETPDPILIIEVLSPSTAGEDREEKLPDYRSRATVQEVLLIDPEKPFAELHRRLDGDRWLTFLHRGADARLVLDSVGLDVALGDLYPPTSDAAGEAGA